LAGPDSSRRQVMLTLGSVSERTMRARLGSRRARRWAPLPGGWGRGERAAGTVGDRLGMIARFAHTGVAPQATAARPDHGDPPPATGSVTEDIAFGSSVNVVAGPWHPRKQFSTAGDAPFTCGEIDVRFASERMRSHRPTAAYPRRGDFRRRQSENAADCTRGRRFPERGAGRTRATGTGRGALAGALCRTCGRLKFQVMRGGSDSQPGTQGAAKIHGLLGAT